MPENDSAAEADSVEDRRAHSLTFDVPPAAAGERLDWFVASKLGSRAAATRAIDAGALVDGRSRQKSYRLEGGEHVALGEPIAPPLLPPPQAPRIVWSDDHLAVVDKPAGLVVHPGAGRPSGTMVDALADMLAGGEAHRRGIVHRLDRDTSGLLVVARSEEAYLGLSALVRRRALERTYLALVRGRPRSHSGRIEAPIGRDRSEPTRVSLDTDSPRDAVTHFECVRHWERHALLEVRLETGRMHQIRVHLAAIELPVVGDRVYSAPDPLLSRQFLHASRLRFTHPLTGEELDVGSPLPADLQSFLDTLD